MDRLAHKKYDLDHTVGIIAVRRCRCKGGHKNFCCPENTKNMKKLLLILIGSLALACGDNRDRSNAREAAAGEDAEIGSGEEVSPLLELDSADRFEVDTISSSGDAKPDRDDN